MFIALLIFLILLTAFFSLSETGMMAVNRYRLRHLARKSNVKAVRVLKLLERPDRLLGVILIGNTFSTILASAIATMLALQWFGDIGAFIATISLTLIILIFAEIVPKTIAALHARRVALLVSAPLAFLLRVFYPLVWIINIFTNGVLRIFGVIVNKHKIEPLSIDELRSVVYEATTGRASIHYQSMLLRVLDMQQITVEEVMVPKSEIYGIDLSKDWATIVAQMLESKHAYLPMYDEHIDKIQGVVTLQEAMVQLCQSTFGKEGLLKMAQDPYFIPEGTLLDRQLLNFQQHKQHIGLVVDEYGDIQGILTLGNLLEEIAGDLTLDRVAVEEVPLMQKDNSVLVDGSISVRELNRLMNWRLPLDGPRTLSGLIIDYLESIPKTTVCVSIAGYPMEVISVLHHTIRQVRVWPPVQRNTM